MCVSPLGGARVTRKVAILPTHTSGMVRLVYEGEMLVRLVNKGEMIIMKDHLT